MNRILLFDTAIATSNIGDEIIFSSAKAGLAPVLQNASLFRLGTHIENYSAFQMFLHHWIRPDRKIQWIVEKADLKLICGTNLLVENLLTPRPQFMLNPANKSLYSGAVLVGVGRDTDYSRFKNRYTADLYRKVLSREFFHSVRDEATKSVLDTVGIRSINTGCPTLWMMTEEKCASIPRRKADHAVFSVSGYEKLRDPQKDRYQLACILKNYDQVYAWVQTAVDEEYIRQLISPEENGIQMVYSLNHYEEILNRKNIDYIGSRLHGGIFALQHNVRSLIISIDERAEGFHESTNLPILRRSEIENLDTLINGEIETRITLRKKEIDAFLGQFLRGEDNV